MEKFTSNEFVAKLISITGDITNSLDTYLSGTDKLRMMSFIFLALAILLFLFLIIVVYVRNVVSSLRGGNVKKNKRKEAYEEYEAEDEVLMDEEEAELEKELQRELEFAKTIQQIQQQEEQERIEKENRERMERERLEQMQIEEEKDSEELQQQIESEKKYNERIEENNVFNERKKYKEAKIDIDWKIGQKNKPQEQISDIESLSLSYKQSSVELNNLIGLAIDMLGRGVDDLKIAQTLNFKNQGKSDENEILKIIDALKEFINLSIKGKFAKLKDYAQLPNEDQALYHLANGDSSLALGLLENLMDSSIDKANASSSEEKRQKLYMEISNYACCFGSLAELNDIMLATSSYELAIELQSTNVTAWGRLGDVYKKANSTPKAVWAYQNVLNFADGEIDIIQIANANKNISEHLYAEGNSLQAAKLYNSSKQYYDSLGINRRLDKKEIEIIDIIESNKEQSLPDMISKLLSRDRTI